MPLAPWRSPLARALHRNRAAADARYCQLATVNADGYPSNRTVVFRGFWQESNHLQIITDARSTKLAHLQRQPWGAICWYFRQSREQFRLSGEINVIDHRTPRPDLQQARRQMWQNISDNARAQFLWPDPGVPKADPAAFEVVPDPATIPETFVLLWFNPEQVEHLELRGEPQNRTRYQYEHRTGQWQVEALNP
ncbi:MAG: pyridoxamine 5'-phosphate oxidase [Spirulina sp. SIO3F2]|nr:pyridoxamine 5'-phosphate oxidase [Spirulina sp. SIO3F2]